MKASRQEREEHRKRKFEEAKHQHAQKELEKQQLKEQHKQYIAHEKRKTQKRKNFV